MAKKLQRAFGRRIVSLKNEAIEALPNGTPGELAAKANEIARKQGYEYEFTAEKFKRKLGRKRRGVAVESGERKPAANETYVVVEAAQQVGGLTRLKKLV